MPKYGTYAPPAKAPPGASGSRLARRMAPFHRMWYPEIDGSAILVEDLTLERGAGWQSIFAGALPGAQ
jgi:hypothetical protein